MAEFTKIIIANGKLLKNRGRKADIRTREITINREKQPEEEGHSPKETN
jgi:hypothetical protein